ncbi:unnamed protein product [Symbiodinium natans]|uniref:Peptidase A2 domain-containing protein n=1 Tax=Symbiodinium natans TaxID=878477 RepID=A0A812T1P0_9DINO|nr:unnamed protein product [Symbiodinium natans]
MWYEEYRPEVKQESVENLSPSPSAQEEDQPEVRQESIENPSPSPSVQEASEDRVRTVRFPGYEDLIEVVLDSGADCHVLPLSYYSEDLGEVELPALKMVITDAQGNAIRTTEARTNITFEFQRSDGRVIKVKNTAVFGQVTQPLFAVGKLYKVGWGIEPQDAYSAFLTKLVKRKNGTSVSYVPIRIYRAAMENGQDEVPISIRKLTLTKELKDDIKNGKYEEGWFYLTDGRPVRIDWDVNTTYSLGRDEGKSFKYRTTLRTRYEEEQIIWEEMEFYECVKE